MEVSVRPSSSECFWFIFVMAVFQVTYDSQLSSAQFYDWAWNDRGSGLSVVGIATVLRDGRAGVRIPRFFSCPERPGWPCSPPRHLYSGYRGVIMFTTHLYIVPRWRMSGAVPLRFPYAFMAWTGKVLPIPSIVMRTFPDLFELYRIVVGDKS